MLRFHALHPDWTLILSAALPASLLALALSLCVLSYTLRRGHRAQRGELARIFEQLDLLRFDAQQAAVAAAPTAPAPMVSASREAALAAAVMARETDIVSGAGDYYAAAQLAARGSSAVEIANRCGIVNGEARVLVALQQARAKRAAH